jgi:hypothetical protein
VRSAAGPAFLAITAITITIGLSRQEAARARDRAQAEALRAEASKLVTLAQLRLEEDPTEALAFTTASLELADTKEARTFAVKVLATAPPAFVLVAGTAARGAFFSRDSKWMAVGGFTPDVRAWREDGEGPIVLPGHEASGGGVQARWTSSGLLVAGVPFHRRLARVWSLPDGVLRRTIDFGVPAW